MSNLGSESNIVTFPKLHPYPDQDDNVCERTIVYDNWSLSTPSLRGSHRMEYTEEVEPLPRFRSPLPTAFPGQEFRRNMERSRVSTPEPGFRDYDERRRSCHPRGPTRLSHRQQYPIEVQPEFKHPFGNLTGRYPSQRRKERIPSSFNPRNSDWRCYIKYFEQCAKYNRWTPSEKAQNLMMALTEEALHVVSHLGDDPSYEQIATTLTGRYAPPEQITVFKSAFRNRRQKIGETATAFAYDLRELAHRAYPTTVSLPEAWLIDQFCTGLLREDTRVHVECQDPRNLQAAISRPETFEAIKTKHKPTESHREVTGMINAVEAAPAKEEMTDLMATMKKLCEELSAANARRSAYQAQREKMRTDKLCFLCKEKGHFKAQCPNAVKVPLNPKGLD